MTVKELIEILNKYPQHMKIMLIGDNMCDCSSISLGEHNIEVLNEVDEFGTNQELLCFINDY